MWLRAKDHYDFKTVNSHCASQPKLKHQHAYLLDKVSYATAAAPPTPFLITMSDDTKTLASSWMAWNQDFVFPETGEQRIHRLKKLRAHWDRATVGRNHTDKWFDDKIVPMYSEPDRFYHTLVHLEEMLGYLEQSDHNNSAELVLSIFFHDLVYEPKSATNEEDSAKRFENFCSDCGIDDALKSRVVRYILATKQHTATEDDVFAQFLLDIDMAVLGKQKEAYWAYAALIRREYSFVEHGVYCDKRAEILMGFLEHPIFGTLVMKDALEQRARENVKAEIDSLEQGVIPGEDAD